MKRLAIVGSRGFAPLELVAQFVTMLRPTTIVVSGGARGVDTAAIAAAAGRGLATEVICANWRAFGRSAGYRRNVQLVNAVHGLVAFWDLQSRGTAHSIALARQRGIWLRVYGPDGKVVPQ